MSKAFKESLHKQSLQLMQEKINAIQQAIHNAQESANNETKSTAGDKHDTSRAMMQLEVEQKSKQLAEAKKAYNFLNAIDPTKNLSKAQIGALVQTNKGFYYLSIGLGGIKVEDKTAFCISLASPIAQKLVNLQAGDQFDFNGVQQEVLAVY